MQTPRRWNRQAAPLWDATPPPPRVKKYERLRVVSSKPLDLLIVNDRLEETWTHYVDSRTVFCTGPHSGCWLDHALVGNPRYGAWLAVQHPKVEVCYLLRLTSVAVSIERRLRELAGQLRGRRLQVWRIHNYEAAEMHCKLLPDEGEPFKVMTSPDVRFNVERMLAADDRPDGPSKSKWKPAADAAAHLAGKHPQLKV